MSSRIVRLALLSVAALSAVFTASADTYYWQGGTWAMASYNPPMPDPIPWGKYDVEQNWKAGSDAGGEGIPSTGDRYFGDRNMALDLNSQEWTINGLTAWGTWNYAELFLKDGTLNVTGTIEGHRERFYLDNAVMCLAPSSTIYPSQGDGEATILRMVNGGRFESFGTFKIYKWDVLVSSDTTLTLDPTWIGMANGPAQKSVFVNDGGLMSFPHGLVFKEGAENGSIVFTQNSGTLELGGSIDMGSFSYRGFEVNILGGTVSVSNDVAFKTMSATINNAVTLDVAADSSIDFSSGFSFGGNLTVIKRGAGEVKIGTDFPLPALSVDGGLVCFGQAGEYSIDDLTLADGCKLAIRAQGIVLNCTTAPANLGFVLDSSLMADGATVLTSNNDDVLSAAKTDFEAQLKGTTFQVSKVGNSLKLAVVTSFVFNPSKSSDMSQATGWSNGSVPAADSEVSVEGVGEADLSSAVPLFKSINVKGGAALTAVGTVTVPSVTIAADSKFAVASGATAVFEKVGDLVTLGDASAKATVEIAEGGTLKVPGGWSYKNCKVILNGTNETTSAGPITFGTANGGETAYFALVADGGTIKTVNPNGDEHGSDFCFAVPTAGGRVVVTEDVVFRNAQIVQQSDVIRDGSESNGKWHGYDGMKFGYGNPADQAFNVIADNTPLNIGSDTFVSGGTTLSLTNGTVILHARHSNSPTSCNFVLAVQNRAKIVVGDGCEIFAPFLTKRWEKTAGAVCLEPDESGFVSIEVLKGGAFRWPKVNGNGKGVIRYADGELDYPFGVLWANWENRYRGTYNLAGMDVPAGKSLIFSGRAEDRLWFLGYHGSEWNYNGQAEPLPRADGRLGVNMHGVFESPFTGSGDVIITNRWTNWPTHDTWWWDKNGRSVQMTVARGDNTCVGRIMAVDCTADGDVPVVEAKLHFANGANWAGTVVWNQNVDFVGLNLSPDKDKGEYETNVAPHVVSFGAVELKTDLHVRVRKDGEGNLINDQINITGAGYDMAGGRIVIDLSEELKSELPKFIQLGTISESATLPEVANGWTVSVKEIDNKVVYGVQKSGFTLFVR